MIKLAIEDAEVIVGRGSGGWVLLHPTNDAILAYCDTKEEAVAVREGINDLARQLRGFGHKVA